MIIATQAIEPITIPTILPTSVNKQLQHISRFGRLFLTYVLLSEGMTFVTEAPQ